MTKPANFDFLRVHQTLALKKYGLSELEVLFIWKGGYKMERATYTKLTIWEKAGMRVLCVILVIILPVFNFSPCAFSWSTETHIYYSRRGRDKKP